MFTHIFEKKEFPPRPIDWKKSFVESFDNPIKFTNETEMIKNLASTSESVLICDDGLWNLALCLSFGSNALAIAAAKAFFKVYEKYQERGVLNYISNYLLSTGRISSGITWEKGERGLKILAQQCPANYLETVQKVIGDETGYDLAYSYNPKHDDSDNIVFVQESRQITQPTGMMATYRVYRGDSSKAARDFLTKHPVKEKWLFIVIETPDGNFARDINGIYKER